MEKKRDEQEMNLQVTDGLTVAVIPNLDHEFLMTTKDVATGYGVNAKTIRGHQRRNKDDFVEDKHFIKGASISSPLLKNTQPHAVYWTKRGIVRLGFFIKSERARLFRDWAEDLIIEKIENRSNFAATSKRLKARYVELPEYRPLIEMVDKAIIICGSQEQLAKRLGTTNSTLSLLHHRPWLVSDKNHRAIDTGCRNLLSRDGKLDTEALEQLLLIDNREIRISLFKKMQKGGLL